MMSLSILIAYQKTKVWVRQLAVVFTTRIDYKKRSLKLPQSSNETLLFDTSVNQILASLKKTLR